MTLSELIDYPRNILEITALWPQRNVSLTYRLRTIFTMSMIASLVGCLTYNATFHLDDFIKLSESLYMLISVVNSFIKVTMLAINGDEFLKLLDMLRTDSFSGYEQLYGPVIENFKKTVRKVHTCYRIQVNGTVIFMILFPVLESKPLPMDFPHFNNGTFHYPFYLFEAVSLYFAAYDNMALDLLIVGVISVSAIQLKILNKKLMDADKNVKNLGYGSGENVEKLTFMYFNECCVHYSDIEIFVKCLLRVFSVNIFVQLGTSVVAICNSGMMILTVEPISVEAVSLFFYITTMFAQLGMYCWFGNFVYLESLEIPTSCYMSQWYEHGTSIRRTLFMLMERTKRPLQIRGLRFVTLSFTTFIGILKWSYSYFTLLRNYMAKGN